MINHDAMSALSDCFCRSSLIWVHTVCACLIGTAYPENIGKLLFLQPEEQMLCHIVRSDTQVEKIVQDTLHLNKHVKEEINGPR